MAFELNEDWQESFQYRPGQQVYLKAESYSVDTIESYDPMMVPPISLVNDPTPRYPEELELVAKSRIPVGLSPVALFSRAKTALSA